MRVWQEWTSGHDSPVYSLAEIVAACENGLGVVITYGSDVVGAAAARVDEDRAWIMMLAQDPGRREQGLGSALLGGLEERLIARGVSRISALLPRSETRLRAFENSEFSPETPLRYFERRIAVRRSDLEPLTRLGASLLPRTLWRELAGMSAVKELIESRLILPLARAELAERLGVRPPRAAVLFGPPGTGKSTFARAVASRLGWPFVELHPSRLASEPGGVAAALRARFVQIAELEHVVVFIDEVDEIASHRDAAAASHASATNELLKSIPLFRERDGRLLLCATNFLRNLDPAFLRHGRFDYLLPVGLPDAEARRSIWRRYVPLSAGRVDVSELARRSARFSPADIEFAARRAAQSVFDEAMRDRPDADGEVEVDTASYLEAIASTRPTVSAEALAEFEADIRELART